MEKQVFGPEDGKTVEINGTTVTVVEVAPSEGIAKRTQEIVFENELSMFLFILGKMVETSEEEVKK